MRTKNILRIRRRILGYSHGIHVRQDDGKMYFIWNDPFFQGTKYVISKEFFDGQRLSRGRCKFHGNIS